MPSKITHHRAGLSATAIRVLEAMVAYGEQHSEIQELTMSLHEFCNLTGLPTTTERAELVLLMSKLRRTISTLRSVDDAKPKSNELLVGSWPVFQGIFITQELISFEVSPYMWQSLGWLLKLENIGKT